MVSKLGAADGEEVAEKPRPRATFHSATGSRRHPLALAVRAALTVLIEELDDLPSSTRVELRTIRARLERVYRLETLANASEIAWDSDGDAEIPE